MRSLQFSFRDLPVRLVGIATVIAAVAATIGAYAVGSTGLFADTYEVSAVLEETAGLRSGDPVRVAGIEVGRVSSVEPDFDQGVVVVTFDLDSGVELGPETTLEVALATLLGGRYVRLAGPVVEPFLEDLPPEQRRIPVERTRLPLGVIDALGQLTTTAEELDADAIDELLGRAAELARDNAGETGDILDDVVTLAEVLNARRQQIEDLVDDTVQVTDALAGRDETIARLIDTSQALLAEIATRQDQVRLLLGSGSEAATTLADLIERNRDELDTILAGLDATTDVLDGRVAEVDETLAAAGPTVGALADIGKTGSWVDVVLTGLSFVQLRNIMLEALG
ncbi:MCE family protein [Actinospongicola halichondriae]|uniref:MCE family protein n=1 Tax=Actinospongicola halichondriae TaxID=3236844 RepID=UPI003D3ED38F